jgi:hypothetical protein
VAQGWPAAQRQTLWRLKHRAGRQSDRAYVDLNDRVALEQGMADALHLPGEQARIAALHVLADPQRKADHALYDDLGNPQAEPHLIRATDKNATPDLRDTAIDGIADRTPEDGWRWPISPMPKRSTIGPSACITAASTATSATA